MGKVLPQVGKDLYAGDGLLMFWSHEPVAHWQDERWLADMRRSLRPSAYARMIENQFVSSESQFVDLSAWDQCIIPDMLPLHEDKQLPIWVGVDASVKRDSTALVACAYSKQSKCVRLVAHRVFQPSPNDPIDFEQTVAATVLDWRSRFRLRKVYFDPFQMVAVAQWLAKQGVKIEEFAQTVPNLTAATSNLFDLIQSRSIVLYPDAGMRLAISRAIIHESSRGWRLDKAKQHHKIDLIVALSMAALASVRGQVESSYPADLSWVNGPNRNDEQEAARAFTEQRLAVHIARYASSSGLGRF
jgi:phage terminase large subunit-like protein